MKSKNIYNLNIILISTILVLSKYIISYALNYEEDLKPLLETIKK